MSFGTLLNPVFAPLLKMPSLVAILLVSLLVSVIITYVYKWMTDQNLMKELKTKQKEFQKKIKGHKSNPKEAMKLQKKAMEVNMQYMKHSFKPTLITFLPIIIIFAWLNANLAYDPISPGEQFSAELEFKEGISGDVMVSVPLEVVIVGDAKKTIESRKIKFDFKSKEGEYLLVFNKGDRSYSKELIVTSDQRYAEPIKLVKNDELKSIKLSNNKLIALNIFSKEEGGWTSGRLGWLGVYILSSIVFSMGLRKLLKLY